MDAGTRFAFTKYVLCPMQDVALEAPDMEALDGVADAQAVDGALYGPMHEAVMLPDDDDDL